MAGLCFYDDVDSVGLVERRVANVVDGVCGDKGLPSCRLKHDFPRSLRPQLLRNNPRQIKPSRKDNTHQQPANIRPCIRQVLNEKTSHPRQIPIRPPATQPQHTFLSISHIHSPPSILVKLVGSQVLKVNGKLLEWVVVLELRGYWYLVAYCGYAKVEHCVKGWV